MGPDQFWVHDVCISDYCGWLLGPVAMGYVQTTLGPVAVALLRYVQITLFKFLGWVPYQTFHYLWYDERARVMHSRVTHI